MNSFGILFRVALCGESHGAGILVSVEGLPAGLDFEKIDWEKTLRRRKAAARGTTARHEPDIFQVLSGVYQGHCTGAPLCLFVPNTDVQSASYATFSETPRPGHVDVVAAEKYFGYADMRGSGVFSGRLTVGLVLAGTLAATCLTELGIHCDAQVTEIGGHAAPFDAVIEEAITAGDSLGGVVSCRVDGVPAGWGAPFFDSVESLLAHGLFAIPGVRGVSFGNGWAGARMRGSEFNDAFQNNDSSFTGKTRTNHSGGIVGGITNGNPIEFEVAFRPPASIAQPQQSIRKSTGEEVSLTIGGRHDVCFVRRCPVIVESIANIVLYDLYLQRKAEVGVN